MAVPASPGSSVRAFVAIAALTVAAAAAAAVDLRLEPEAVSQAISLGQTAVEADVTRFHHAYRLEVSRPPIDYIDVVTPYRRIVLAARARWKAGDRRWGQRQAMELEAAAPRQIDLYAELTFHPLNTFVLVPVYRIQIVPASGRAIEARHTSSLPRYGPRVDGALVPFSPTPLPGGALRGRSEPMLGATIVASFDAEVLAAACAVRCEIVVEEEGRSRVQVPLSLGDLR